MEEQELKELLTYCWPSSKAGGLEEGLVRRRHKATLPQPHKASKAQSHSRTVTDRAVMLMPVIDCDSPICRFEMVINRWNSYTERLSSISIHLRIGDLRSERRGVEDAR
ncbi:hypothetical protein L6452_24790 [Arctium lappa]|uniref:Uncharacterized protein n=1 Tax=Arctium lappa TaxID=4217 RepID=A0ACB9ABA0_ARCLA|nr:hypothetical protein L6452_24790 [Arctium lappa]